jgi:tetratricopeptide (TPR) repeat protein
MTAAMVFAASGGDGPTTASRFAEIENRILVDKLNTQRESFEEKTRRLETKVIQLERDLEHSTSGFDKRIDDLRSHLGERVNDASDYTENLFAIYTGMFVVFLTVLSIVGWRTVKGWIEGKVQDLSEKKIDEIVTDDFTRKIIETKGEVSIGNIVNEVKDEIKKVREESRKIEEMRIAYEKKLKEIENNPEFKNLSVPLPEPLKESILELIKNQPSIKEEKEFTYDDWFVKGIAQYENKDYGNAAKSFINAYEIEESIDILNNAALAFDKFGNYDNAEKYYKMVLDSNPNHANTLGNYALFMKKIREDYDKAEEFYKRAIETDPNHANNLGGYAIFLRSIREDYDKAEELYKRAIEANPNHAGHLGNYAVFMESIREDYDKAEELYKRAIEADPSVANILGNYAIFLRSIREDYDKAEELYKRAIEADPSDANILGNYAIFMKSSREDYDKAEELYKRAIEANPNHAGHLGNYASFLKSIREDYDKAEELYKRAIEADPSDANILGNYAGLLLARDSKEEGFKKLERAQRHADRNDLRLELWFYKYAHKDDAAERIKALKEIKKLIGEGERSDGYDMTDNVKRAIAEGHPNPDLLTDLERVISAGKDAKDLEKYEEWKQA